MSLENCINDITRFAYWVHRLEQEPEKDVSDAFACTYLENKNEILKKLDLLKDMKIQTKEEIIQGWKKRFEEKYGKDWLLISLLAMVIEVTRLRDEISRLKTKKSRRSSVFLDADGGVEIWEEVDE